jgi:hypothetical protein
MCMYSFHNFQRDEKCTSHPVHVHEPHVQCGVLRCPSSAWPLATQHLAPLRTPLHKAKARQEARRSSEFFKKTVRLRTFF